jgi:hypothetical protein
MRFAEFVGLAIAGLCSTTPSIPANAATYTIQQIGAWQAFGGTDNGGIPVCGIMNVGEGGRVFAIKTWSNTPYLSIQVFKSSWRIPQGQEVAIELQFDSHNPWGPAHGIAVPPNGIQFRVQPNATADFLREFELSSQVFVRFPGGTEQPWRGGLSGTAAMSITFLDCVAKMKGQATQPYAQTPTQPYSQTPTQPYQRQVTQPYGNGATKL